MCQLFFESQDEVHEGSFETNCEGKSKSIQSSSLYKLSRSDKSPDLIVKSETDVTSSLKNDQCDLTVSFILIPPGY